MGPLCGDKEPFRGQPGRGDQGQGVLGEKLESQEPGPFGSLMQEESGGQTLGSKGGDAGGLDSWD